MPTPTRIDQYGTQEWLKNGKLHRLDLPAVIYADGRMVWYQRGLWHRDDGPAYAARWYMCGRLHREDGPAWISSSKGFQWWLLNDVKMK